MQRVMGIRVLHVHRVASLDPFEICHNLSALQLSFYRLIFDFFDCVFSTLIITFLSNNS